MSGQTADEYIKRFKIYAAESKVMQDRPLVEWFIKGLNTPLLNRILNLENPPTTIRGWYTTASKMDNQWRRGRQSPTDWKEEMTQREEDYASQTTLPDTRHLPETPMQWTWTDCLSKNKPIIWRKAFALYAIYQGIEQAIMDQEDLDHLLHPEGKTHHHRHPRCRYLTLLL